MKTIVKQSISTDSARTLIQAAEAKALEMGVPVAIAVVDESGLLKALSRMDGTVPSSIEMAQNKAYTAVVFSVPTDQWFDFIKDDGALLHGLPQTPRMVIIGGGYPIVHEGAIVGAIGVSGGHYSQDMEIAQAALASLQ